MDGTMIFGKTRQRVVLAIPHTQNDRAGWLACDEWMVKTVGHRASEVQMFYPADMYTFEPAAC